MKYAYMRISTNKQSTDRQESILNDYFEKNNLVMDDWFKDVITGKTFDRPDFDRLKNTVVAGDTVYFTEVDRLGRDWDGIKEAYKWFEDRNINVIILEVPALSLSIYKEDGTIDLNIKLIKSIVLDTYCFASQNEREKLARRTKDALKAKKEAGIKLGRPTTKKAQEVIDLIVRMTKEGYSTREIQFKTGKSRQYVCKIKKQYA